MAILHLVIAPDPLLKQISKPISEVNDEVRKLMDDMLETMYHEDGAGLAAVQIGVLKRVLIVDISIKSEGNEDERNPIFMANPEISYFSDTKCTRNEGCLSFPGQRLEVERPEKIRVSYLDYNNKRQNLEASGWLSTAIQHEFDHLNGIVIPDHTSRLRKQMMMKKALKLKKTIKL